MISAAASLPRLLTEPWLIRAEAGRAMVIEHITELATAWKHGAKPPLIGRAHDDDDDDPINMRERFAHQCGVNEYVAKVGLPPIYEFNGATGLAILNVQGVIAYGIDLWDWYYGYYDLAIFQAALEELSVLSGGLRHVVLNIESPGGYVTGVQESAQMLADFGQKVAPVTAFTSSLAASAAYWLASAAGRIWAAPSAIVGSIGAYMAYLDWNGFREKIGAKLELFRDGKFKAAGLLPLSEEERQYFQDSVDRTGAHFKTAVTARRRNLQRESMQGQAWQAQDAPAGLLDRADVINLSAALIAVAGV